MSEFVLHQMEVGPMNNYIYFIGDQKSREIAVVDPAWNVSYILEEVKRLDYEIVASFITHVHPDHNNGLGELLATKDIPIYVSEKEAPFYKPFASNIKSVKASEKLAIGSISVEFLHTPGHTPGSQCFYVQNSLVAGDTLFVDGCGRCDLPGGNAEEMYNTLYKKLWHLPNDTIIFPGHNYHEKPNDTWGNQKKTNHFLTCQNIQEFLRERMGL